MTAQIGHNSSRLKCFIIIASWIIWIHQRNRLENKDATNQDWIEISINPDMDDTTLMAEKQDPHSQVEEKLI